MRLHLGNAPFDFMTGLLLQERGNHKLPGTSKHEIRAHQTRSTREPLIQDAPEGQGILIFATEIINWSARVICSLKRK